MSIGSINGNSVYSSGSNPSIRDAKHRRAVARADSRSDFRQTVRDEQHERRQAEKQSAPTQSNVAEFNRVFSEYQHSSRVQREGISSHARRAINAYENISLEDHRQNIRTLMGIDILV